MQLFQIMAKCCVTLYYLNMGFRSLIIKEKAYIWRIYPLNSTVYHPPSLMTWNWIKKFPAASPVGPIDGMPDPNRMVESRLALAARSDSQPSTEQDPLTHLTWVGLSQREGSNLSTS